MSNEFFVDVISNASMDIFPNNKLSEFTNRLPQKLNLDGEWLVALQEIIYPLSHKSPQRTIPYSLTGSATFTSRRFKYNETENIAKVVERFNNQIRTAYFEENKGVNDPPEFFIKTDENKKTKVVLKLGSTTGHYVIPMIDQSFLRLLGWDRDAYYKAILEAPKKKIKEIEAPHQPDNGHRSNLVFIYSDIVHEHFVGDSYSRTLRVILITKDKEDILEHITLTTPYYYPVRMNTIEDISISIRDETGENIKFRHGRVFLSAHFKRKESERIFHSFPINKVIE